MLNSLLGSKGQMNQGFIEGRRIPVTKINLGPCTVTQVKKMEKDGYWAVQLGFGSRKIKNLSKALQGHLKAAIKDNTSPKYVREVRLTEEPTYKVGDVISVSSVFKVGDVISVSGTSKGKGFAGVVKRHHFRGGPRTHGQSDRERAPGSIGQTTTPGRVYKGKKMGGRMGGESVTVKNLQIVAMSAETNEIEVAGPVPGITNGLLMVNKLHGGKLEGIAEVEAQVVEGESPEGEAPAEGEAQVEAQAEAPAEEKPTEEQK